MQMSSVFRFGLRRPLQYPYLYAANTNPRINMKKSLWLLVGLLAFACQSPKEEAQQAPASPEAETQQAPARTFPEAMTQVLDAHGGFEKWAKMGTLQYQKGEGEGAEKHSIDLQSRNVRIEGTGYTIGFDGTDAWLSPAEAEFKGSARFYHNLYFYFYAMPFVLADPGISYSEVAPLSYEGKDYPGIKISYGDGVGDSPEDNYILYYDPETKQMAWLAYTVTFRTQQESDSYSLIRYPEWQAVNGLQLPSKLQWMTYQDGVIGEVRNAVPFVNVRLDQGRPAPRLFSKPADARVDGMPEAPKE